MGLRVKIWGTRGSLPAPPTPDSLERRFRQLLEGFFDAGHADRGDLDEYLKALPAHRLRGFGGNTSCVEVRSPGQQILLDAGSGLRNLGYELMRGPCGRGEGEVHLLFTHVHWDHLLGLPFFVPLFLPGNRVHVYAVETDLREILGTLFKRPYFPVALEDIGAEIVYHDLEPREPTHFGDMTVTPYQLDHPDPCWGFRVEHAGRVFAHCVDTECTRRTREELGEDLPLYQGVHLMTFDAQYTLIERFEKVNWGHASATAGIDIAMREGVERVLFMHNDPAASDDKIAEVVAEAQRYYELKLKAVRRAGQPYRRVDWSFAVEGMSVDV